MRNENARKGTSFPARLLTGALVLTGVMLVAFVWITFDSYRNATTEQLRNLHIQDLRGTILQLDEVLTTSARMAALTGELDWERRYRQFEPQLDAAIKEARGLTGHSDGAQAAAQADAANLRLVEMENQAFKFVRAGESGAAKAVLFSDAYEAQKKVYAEGMINLTHHLKEKVTANHRRKQSEAFLSMAIVACCILLLLSTWVSVLRNLSSWRKIQSSNLDALTRAEESLRVLNAGLEMRVEDRSRELEVIHLQLVEASRRGGMAEIATNVLHNVGNVLNSVNVSTGLVVETLQKSKASSLGKVVMLLRENSADLGKFITEDPRGQQLPGYLAQLSDHLRADQESMSLELDSLRRNVEHIKEIVTMQQSYATFGGVKELVDVVSLVEDSLSMNEEAFLRHRVELVCHFEEVPLLNLEKHKVLQILVNLLHNAKQACQESERLDRRLAVRVVNGGRQVRISVTDNGVGIPPENLNRIFNHGFTTRAGGHGFGLHSGALAAREMGGSLTVESNGLGHGASFTLALPLLEDRKASGDLAA